MTVIIVGTAASGALTAAAGCAARAGAVAGSWGQAIEMPGLGAIYPGGGANVFSLSCASAGLCTAGGRYQDRHGHDQGFVAVERHGRWGQATGVPGLGALNTGGSAFVLSVSCASAGSCAAGGFYTDRRGHSQGFVVVEQNGRWGQAIEVPGLGALNAGGDAYVVSLSCGAAGSCAVGGNYKDGDHHGQGFVVVEQNGAWGQAIEVPGLGILNAGGGARVVSLSCGAAGSCAVGGNYKDGDHHGQGFVAVEQNGAWGQAIEVPGLGALNAGGDAQVSSVSCASAGNCAAGGHYTDGGDNEQGFVASERDGMWGTATEVPGLAALSIENAGVDSVSCASAGNCAAGGDDSPYGLGFVVSEKNGAWGQAIEVPGLGELNKGAGAYVSSVSCAPAGGCAVGGFYTDRRGHSQGFVASQAG